MKNPSLLGSSTRSKSSSTTTPCCSKVGIKRGPWTPEEDEVLANYIKREGEGKWRMLPKRAGLLRCGKSCRLRWINYLRPSVKRGRIAPDEEDLILRLHRLLGNRWSLIAGRIPGRTDNEIKNYWNSHLSKKLINQGIDPRTHKPLNLINNTNSSVSPQELNHGPVLKSNPNPPPNFEFSSELEEKTIIISSTQGQDFTPTYSNLGYDHQQSHNQQVVENGTADWYNPEGDNLNMGQPSCSHGNGNDQGDYIENCNEDMFSSFLDSLINDNIFVNQNQQQQQQQQQSNDLVAAPASANHLNFSDSGIWEAEIMSSMVAFGNEQNSSNIHLQHQP